MTPAEKIAAEANARVEGWASLSHAERVALLDELPVLIKPLHSGGVMASIRGVDRWFPSVRHAEAELALFES